MRLYWGEVPGIGMAESITDVRRAERYSERFAQLVRAKAGERNALAALDNRLATIGITENAEAFNAQRRASAEVIAERVGLIEIWDAVLDQRTCSECWRMNREQALVGRGFPGGLRPGQVHARCRCTSHFERITYH